VITIIFSVISNNSDSIKEGVDKVKTIGDVIKKINKYTK